MNVRQWLPLIGISISVFIFNMSEFMPIGLLTDIANDFHISESQAGLIISFYAWAVAILSLPAMLVLRKMEYRRMLLLAVILFMLFQFVAGISTNYWMLMIARIGVAVSHAIFWSIAAPIAVRVVDEKYSKIAIGAVATGTSVAMIVGLPLGRVIGLIMGWRMAFLLIAAIALFTLIYLFIVFPKVENPGTFTLQRVPEIFRNKIVVCIYILMAVAVTGYYTGYSYIEPFLAQIGGMNDSSITIALIVFGAAGIIGSIVFSKIYNRTKYVFLPIALLGSAVSLLIFRTSAEAGMIVIAVCIAWGFFVTAFNVSTQNEIIRFSPDDSTAVIMSLYSGIYNVGIATGSILGGVVTDGPGIGNIGYVGGAFLLVATLFTTFVLMHLIKKKDQAVAN